MISAVEWVPKGVADPTPKKYEMSPAELALLEQQTELEVALKQSLNDAEDDASDQSGDETSRSLPKIDPKSLPAELRMDEYSSDEDDNDAIAGSAIGNMLVGTEPVAHESTDRDIADEDDDGDQTDLAIRDSDEDDDESEYDSDDLGDVPDTREYMPVDVEGLQAMGLSQVGASEGPIGGIMDDEDEDDDSDAEDVNLSPDDAIMVVAKTEEDFASLEVHVYEPKTGNLFVHHDIPLPSYPLCLAHGDINSDGGAGNYVAVGTFSPGIEIWNLDILNPLEPSCILGGEDTSAADELMKFNMSRAASGKKAKRKKLPGGGLRSGSHTEAVMALSWNKIHRQVLASGSADCKVKLWDITKAGTDAANVATCTHHSDKVQALQWHPTEGTLLASGSYDRTVSLVDARNVENTSKRIKIPADCETVVWDPFNPQLLTVAAEDGTIACWDVRKFDTSSPVWSFVASEYGGVSDLSYNSNVPGMLATCSIDRAVTLWDTYSSDGVVARYPPRACGNRDMGVGKLYTMSFYPSSPWLLVCGGSGNQVSLWDLSSETALQTRFGPRCTQGGQTPSEEQTNVEDFEAVMATEDKVMEKFRENIKPAKKGKGKKKAHRKGR